MIKIEVTDTFSGEANYSWVNRYELDPIENQTDLQLIRRIKKVIGYSGVKCKKFDYGDMITLKPINFCTIVFITFPEN